MTRSLGRVGGEKENGKKGDEPYQGGEGRDWWFKGNKGVRPKFEVEEVHIGRY